MANPRKVLDFLDVTGDWDPSLLLVMAGAVCVTALVFCRFLSRNWNSGKTMEWPLVAGAAIFGIGWGVGGYCPGPAVTALANLSAGMLVFVGAMVAGGILARIPPLNTGCLAQW